MFKTVPIPFDMIYSQHGSLKPQYMYLRRLYEPANADSSLIQKTFINTQLPPVTSLFFCCTVRRINGAIHYMYTIPLSTCKFILILLFSLVLQMKNQLIHRTSLSLQIQLILPWLFFFFLYLKWSINYFTESQSRSPLPDEQIPISSISIKDNIVKGGGGESLNQYKNLPQTV